MKIYLEEDEYIKNFDFSSQTLTSLHLQLIYRINFFKSLYIVI